MRMAQVLNVEDVDLKEELHENAQLLDIEGEDLKKELHENCTDTRSRR
jgi:hypothetical protein